MDELLEALQLMAAKAKPDYPFNCSHDTLTVCIDPALFSTEELKRLDELGFHDYGEGYFQSFRFGSA